MLKFAKKKNYKYLPMWQIVNNGMWPKIKAESIAVGISFMLKRNCWLFQKLLLDLCEKWKQIV